MSILSAGFEARVSFDCPKCGAFNRELVPAPTTDWRDRPPEESVTSGTADAICGVCTAPYHLTLQNLQGHVHSEIEGHPEVEVTSSDAYLTAEFEEFSGSWDLIRTPSDNLVETLTDIERVICGQHARFYVRVLSRMAFMQQFAALEAYLADTITKKVLEHPHLMEKSLRRIKELSELKIPLPIVASSPNIVNASVADYFQNLLYHNFDKIDRLWNSVFDFGIFPNLEVKERMFKAKDIRHDCSHRNGRDKNGAERTELNFKFVMQVDQDIRDMLDHIEDTFYDSHIEN